MRGNCGQKRRRCADKAIVRARARNGERTGERERATSGSEGVRQRAGRKSAARRRQCAPYWGMICPSGATAMARQRRGRAAVDASPAMDEHAAHSVVDVVRSTPWLGL